MVSAAMAFSKAKSPRHVDDPLLVVYGVGDKEAFGLEAVAFTPDGWRGCY
jgi:hypothetical protein